MLDVRGVHKAYGDVTALDGLDLLVPAGRCTALLGPNGAGKSTLISCIAGLLRPDAGHITVGGDDVVDHPERTRPRIGLAPQDTGVYEGLTVRENLIFFSELAGLRGRAAVDRAGEAAESVDLTSLWTRTAQQLSGGEKRRLHTACALVTRAPLLLLDEPTVGADVATRAALLATVNRLTAEGTAVLYSTHYFSEVHHLGAGVAIVDHGRLVAAGSPENLVETHGHGAVELVFSGDAPDLGPAADGAIIEARPEAGETSVRIVSDDPAAGLAELLGGLGPEADRLREIDLAHPDLDTVFLELTGRRYEDEDEAEAGADP